MRLLSSCRHTNEGELSCGSSAAAVRQHRAWHAWLTPHHTLQRQRHDTTACHKCWLLLVLQLVVRCLLGMRPCNACQRASLATAVALYVVCYMKPYAMPALLLLVPLCCCSCCCWHLWADPMGCNALTARCCQLEAAAVTAVLKRLLTLFLLLLLLLLLLLPQVGPLCGPHHAESAAQ
jgi:hypothetical protein